MTAVENFGNRAAELALYLSFLRDIDKRSVSLAISRPAGGRIPIAADIRKMLRANFYIVVYNLIESTVRDVLDDIYQDIRTRKVTFPALNDSWRHAYVRQRLRKNFDDHAHPNKHYDATLVLCDSLMNSAELVFASQRLPLSGTVDQYMINDLSRRFGIAFRPPKRSRAGADLETIKERRNALAHGVLPFSELGRDLYVRDLERENSRSMAYLGHFVEASAEFIVRRGYLRPAPAKLPDSA